jgi:hypothetical protein
LPGFARRVARFAIADDVFQQRSHCRPRAVSSFFDLPLGGSDQVCRGRKPFDVGQTTGSEKINGLIEKLVDAGCVHFVQA